METQKPVEQNAEDQQSIPELEWVDRITSLLDSRFRLPLLKWKFGLDPILGLVPVVGDIVTFVIAAFMVVIMVRHGASGALVLRMTANIVLDFVGGSIPLVGDIFDFRMRANRRNYHLLREHYYENEHQGSGWGIIFWVFFMLMLIVPLTIWGVYRLLAWAL
jgi:hypothetical protein